MVLSIGHQVEHTPIDPQKIKAIAKSGRICCCFINEICKKIGLVVINE